MAAVDVIELSSSHIYLVCSESSHPFTDIQIDEPVPGNKFLLVIPATGVEYNIVDLGEGTGEVQVYLLTPEGLRTVATADTDYALTDLSNVELDVSDAGKVLGIASDGSIEPVAQSGGGSSGLHSDFYSFADLIDFLNDLSNGATYTVHIHIVDDRDRVTEIDGTFMKSTYAGLDYGNGWMWSENTVYNAKVVQSLSLSSGYLAVSYHTYTATPATAPSVVYYNDNDLLDGTVMGYITIHQ